MFATGEAGACDLEQAYVWLWLGALHGETGAEQAFQSLLPALSGDQLVRAAKRVAQFQPEGEGERIRAW